jgi:hypothetical protein
VWSKSLGDSAPKITSANTERLLSRRHLLLRPSRSLELQQVHRNCSRRDQNVPKYVRNSVRSLTSCQRPDYRVGQQQAADVGIFCPRDHVIHIFGPRCVRRLIDAGRIYQLTSVLEFSLPHTTMSSGETEKPSLEKRSDSQLEDTQVKQASSEDHLDFGGDSTLPPPPSLSDEEERKLWRKVDLRLMPILSLMYLLSLTFRCFRCA